MDKARRDGDSEGGVFLEGGRALRPDLPEDSCVYGFTIIAKAKPGREAAIREYGKTVENAIFTTLFGGTDSLKYFWRNVATM